MNERIKEFRFKAAEYTNEQKPLGIMKWNEMRDAKFAELIVRECAEVIAPMGDWCGGHGEPSMPSTMECAKRLKEHFGVEE